MCASPTTPTDRSCMMSASPSPPAGPWRRSGPAAPASRRSHDCCSVSTTSAPAASASTARTSARSRRTACAPPSAWCRRTPCCSTTASTTTSPTADPTPAATRYSKPRVAIARTLLKNPAILILDEATSALDTKTEKAIQAELLEIARSRTSLIIAHRLSTVVEADEILVMEGKHNDERGQQTELLEKNGVYAHMWALQQQAEEEVA